MAEDLVSEDLDSEALDSEALELEVSDFEVSDFEVLDFEVLDLEILPDCFAARFRLTLLAAGDFDLDRRLRVIFDMFRVY